MLLVFEAGGAVSFLREKSAFCKCRKHSKFFSRNSGESHRYCGSTVYLHLNLSEVLFCCCCCCCFCIMQKRLPVLCKDCFYAQKNPPIHANRKHTPKWFLRWMFSTCNSRVVMCMKGSLCVCMYVCVRACVRACVRVYTVNTGSVSASYETHRGVQF